MSGISNDLCLPTCAITMRTGRILDSRRTRQQVVQQKFALWARARFNPSRDSAGCTIAMRWQRRLTSNSSEDQMLFSQPGRGAVHIFCEHLSPDDNSLQSQTEGLTRMRKKSLWCTTIWRTTGNAQ